MRLTHSNTGHTTANVFKSTVEFWEMTSCVPTESWQCCGGNDLEVYPLFRLLQGCALFLLCVDLTIDRPFN
jgi:hypothetical protein